MSLVPTYVLADDDHFYKDPVLGEKPPNHHHWFLCFDDDDPAELVWRRELPSGHTFSLEEMFERLEKLGLPLTRSRYHFCVRESSRCFSGSTTRKMKFFEANAAFVDLKQPIPVALIREPNTGIPLEKFREKRRDCVFYDFGRLKVGDTD